jgi:hypothetical protein
MLFLGPCQELRESFWKDSVTLCVTPLVVGTTIKSVKRQKLSVRLCSAQWIVCYFPVCLPLPVKVVQEFPAVPVPLGVTFTNKPAVDGESAG